MVLVAASSHSSMFERQSPRNILASGSRVVQGRTSHIGSGLGSGEADEAWRLRRAPVRKRSSNSYKATPTRTARPPVPGEPCRWSRPSSERAHIQSMLTQASYDALAMALSIRES